MTLQDILTRFTNPKPAGAGYQACCPAHDDRKASLSIKQGDRGVVLFCHAGCETLQVCAALGIEIKDLFDEPLEKVNGHHNGNGTKPNIVATYDYRDASGHVLYQVVRFEPKDFRQRRPDGHGGWIWNLQDTPRVLYRLPELLAADPDEHVFIVEGEKDVDALRALGLVATCNVGGAGKWRDTYSEHLDHRVCIIPPDNDEPGENHANQIRLSLLKRAPGAIVRILNLPGLPEKGDVSNWLAAGGTAEALRDLATQLLMEPTEIQPEDLETVFDDADMLADHGNAARFLNAYRETTKYVYARKKFMSFDGKRWSDDQGIVEDRANRTVQGLRHIEAKTLEAQEKAFKHYVASQKPERRNAILTLMRAEVRIEFEAFDANPELFNVANGTVDLSTGELLPHDPAHLCMKISKVKYQKNAKCPKWLRFLLGVFNKDKALIRFIQKAVGYSLSGLSVEQVFFLLYGVGRNGKTTFINVLSRLIGEYATHAQMDVFTAKNRSSGGHNEDLARLCGARLITAIETEESKRLSEALIKQITGGDPVTASYKHEHSFTFTPVFKLWLAANHKPVIRGTDEGIWRRPLMIPFVMQFEKDPEKAKQQKIKVADKFLENKLMSELSGILNWAIEGYRLWKDEGLTPPQQVREATEQYRKDSDVLGMFIEQKLEDMPDKSRRGASASQIYKTYCRWCEDNGEYALNQTRFGNAMTERGFQKKKESGNVYYFGVILTHQDSQDSWDSYSGYSPHED